MISITTKSGTNTAGAPDGTNNFKKFKPCFKNPIIVKATIREKPIEKVWKIWLVTVKPKGISPIIFENNIKLNNKKKKGNIFWDNLPACWFRVTIKNSNKLSIKDWKNVGIIREFVNENKKNTTINKNTINIYFSNLVKTNIKKNK